MQLESMSEDRLKLLAAAMGIKSIRQKTTKTDKKTFAMRDMIRKADAQGRLSPLYIKMQLGNLSVPISVSVEAIQQEINTMKKNKDI